MRRVMIIGQPGSGKSWLARALGDATGLPVVHIDLIHWKSGWVERSAAEKDKLVAEVHAQDSWIFEGGHSRSWSERMARADTCIWLDVPLWKRSWRVFRRTIQHYGQPRPDLPEGCPERFNWEFIRWIWNTRNTGRIRPQAIRDNPPAHLTFHHLRRNSEVRVLLENCLTHRKP